MGREALRPIVDPTGENRQETELSPDPGAVTAITGNLDASCQAWEQVCCISQPNGREQRFLFPHANWSH